MKLALLFTFTLAAKLLFAQFNSIQTLDFNRAHSQSFDDGFLLSSTDSTDGYRINKDSLQKVIYSSSFWFGAIDNSNNLLMSGQIYRGQGNDQFSGPYSTSNSYTSSEYLTQYQNSIWTVSAEEIYDHIEQFNDSNYIAPDAIENWPGNGDTTLGVNFQLAPFEDLNNNGIYEPQMGEYPKIKGCKATYIITNDAAKQHSSNGLPLGIEMHYMIYQLSENTIYDDLTFIKLKVFKRSQLAINNFTITYYLDGDIGNGADDFVGTSPSNDLLYFYNSSNYDNQQSTTPNYYLNPPALGVVCLDGSLYSAGSYNLGSNDPDLAVHYWDLTRGINKFGEKWKDENGIPTFFEYPGVPTDPSLHSAITANETPNDMRGVLSLKPGELFYGESIEKNFAIVPSTSGIDHLNQVEELITRVEGLHVDFDNNNIDECDIALNTETWFQNQESLSVYPNPSQSYIKIKGLGKNQFDIVIYDALGKEYHRQRKVDQNTKIKIDHLPKALFFVKIQKESLNKVVKFIKN